MRGRFYYSAKQEELSSRLHGYTHRVCLLDSGERRAYSEFERVDGDEEYNSALRPHSERWSDSEYLGEGVVAEINGVSHLDAG